MLVGSWRKYCITFLRVHYINQEKSVFRSPYRTYDDHAYIVGPGGDVYSNYTGDSVIDSCGRRLSGLQRLRPQLCMRR